MPKAPEPASTRRRLMTFWVITGFIALTALIAGVMDVFRLQPLFSLLLHLGYPPYFSTLLGVWKILGALALVFPRYPRLKEWAYAGMFFDYSSALVSHLAVGDSPLTAIGPVVSIVALIASWALRPDAVRQPHPIRRQLS